MSSEDNDEDVETVNYRFEANKLQWALFKATKPADQSVNDALVETVNTQIGELLDEEFIERSPMFDERHLEYFREQVKGE